MLKKFGVFPLLGLGIILQGLPDMAHSYDQVYETPNYPANYSNHESDSATIGKETWWQDSGYWLRILGESEQGYDFLQLKQGGVNIISPLSGSQLGAGAWVLVNNDNPVQVLFQSDYSVTKRGYRVEAYPRNTAYCDDCAECQSKVQAANLERLVIVGDIDDNSTNVSTAMSNSCIYINNHQSEHWLKIDCDGHLLKGHGREGRKGISVENSKYVEVTQCRFEDYGPSKWLNQNQSTSASTDQVYGEAAVMLMNSHNCSVYKNTVLRGSNGIIVDAQNIMDPNQSQRSYSNQISYNMTRCNGWSAIGAFDSTYDWVAYNNSYGAYHMGLGACIRARQTQLNNNNVSGGGDEGACLCIAPKQVFLEHNKFCFNLGPDLAISQMATIGYSYNNSCNYIKNDTSTPYSCENDCSNVEPWIFVNDGDNSWNSDGDSLLDMYDPDPCRPEQ